MRKIFAAAAIAACGLLGAGEIDFSRELPRYKATAPQKALLDKEIKIAGADSVKLVDGATVFKTFKLEKDTNYELTFYVKGQNISSKRGDGGRISLNNASKFMRATSEPKKTETGSFDWRKGKFVFNTKDFPAPEIRIGLRLHGTGTIWYDDVQLKKISAAENIQKKKSAAGKGAESFRTDHAGLVKNCRLIPGGIFGFFKPGEKVSFKWFVEPKLADLQYELVVKDENGRNVYTQKRTALVEGFTLPAQENGYYIVHSRIFSGSKLIYSLQSAFVVAPEVTNKDKFFSMGFGVQDVLYDGLKRIGAGSICMKLNLWFDGRPAERLWNFYLTRYGRYINDPEFDIIACLSAGYRWQKHLKPEKQKAGYPIISHEMMGNLQKFITYVAEKHKGRIKTYAVQQEIPSSQSRIGGWTESMFNTLITARVVSRAVKGVDPENKMIVGGCNMQDALKDYERIVMSDLGADFDEYMIDAYNGNWNITLGRWILPEFGMRGFYKEAIAMAASLGKKPLVHNFETGYAISYGARYDGFQTTEQARLTARGMVITKAYPVPTMELHTPTKTLIKALADKDLCMTTIWKPFFVAKPDKTDFVPLPGGAAYITVVRELANAKFVKEINLNSAFGYIFTKQDGSTLAVLWVIEKPRTMASVLPGKARVLNMYGRSSTLKAGKQVLKIGLEPQYFTIDASPAAAAEWVEKMFQDNLPEFMVAGNMSDKQNVRIYVKNLTANTGKGVVRYGKAAKNITVLPEKIATVEFAYQAGAECTFSDANKRVYKAALSDVKNSFYTLRKVKTTPVLDGSGKWLKGVQNGLLHYPDHVRPDSALHPEKRYFRSENFNPDGHNVSVKYYTAYDDKNFYLAAEVDDPIHIQRQEGRFFWRDDSLQFALGVSDPMPAELLAAGEVPQGTEFNYTMALTPAGPRLYKNLGADMGLKDHPFNIVRKNGKTYYEVAIPFKALGGKLKRFGFVVFDNNYTNLKSAPYCLDFTDNWSARNGDSKLKTLKFE